MAAQNIQNKFIVSFFIMTFRRENAGQGLQKKRAANGRPYNQTVEFVIY